MCLDKGGGYDCYCDSSPLEAACPEDASDGCVVIDAVTQCGCGSRGRCSDDAPPSGLVCFEGMCYCQSEDNPCSAQGDWWAGDVCNDQQNGCACGLPDEHTCDDPQYWCDIGSGECIHP